MDSATAEAPSDVTSTPVAKARSPGAASSRCPLLSPISPGEPGASSCPSAFFDLSLSFRPCGTNVWLAADQRDAPDSGYGPSHSGCASFAEAGSSSSSAAHSMVPLSIDIPPPPPQGPAAQLCAREAMFAALDENYSRYMRYLSYRDRPAIGKKVGEPACDVISCLYDSDRSGLVLRTVLFPLLSPCDLRRMRLVSHRWRLAVARHSRGRWRHRRLLSASWRRGCVNNRENSPRGCQGLCDSGAADCSLLKEPGASASSASVSPFLRTGAMKRTQLASPDGGWSMDRRLSLRERFQSASSTLLRSERLARCPGCSNPARISPLGRSSHCESPGGCGATLCAFCGYPAHGEAPCRRRISPTERTAPPPSVSSPEKRLRKKLLQRL